MGNKEILKDLEIKLENKLQEIISRPDFKQLVQENKSDEFVKELGEIYDKVVPSEDIDLISKSSDIFFNILDKFIDYCLEIMHQEVDKILERKEDPSENLEYFLLEKIDSTRAELEEYYESSDMTSYTHSLLTSALSYLEDYVRTRDFEYLEKCEEEASGLLGSEIVLDCARLVDFYIDLDESLKMLVDNTDFSREEEVSSCLEKLDEFYESHLDLFLKNNIISEKTREEIVKTSNEILLSRKLYARDRLVEYQLENYEVAS